MFRSLEESDWISDWRNVSRYFEDHIAAIEQDWMAEDSAEYRPRSHQFSIRGLSGDEPEEPKAFKLQLMVNVKQNPPRPQRVYAGIQLNIAISDVKAFVSALNDFLFKLEK